MADSRDIFKTTNTNHVQKIDASNKKGNVLKKRIGDKKDG
jgi:hypothetical protein